MMYAPEWSLVVGVLLIALLCAPPLALIAFGVLILVALAALLTLLAAIAATPYLLLRFGRRRWAERIPGGRATARLEEAR